MVQIETLDMFVTEHNIAMIDLLKIDTEGYEREVLKGTHELLRNQRIGMIFIETEIMRTPRNFVPIHDLNEIRTEYGYEIFGVYDQQPNIWAGEHSVCFCNVLYISPKLIAGNVNPNTYRLQYSELT